MIATVKVLATVVEDDSGVKSQIPVLLTDQGELTPLTELLLHAEQAGKSRSWMNKLIRATQLFIEYINANKNGFSDPKILFQTFVKRLYTGTVGNDGLDPSGLYWIPTARQTSNQYINALTTLTDWLVQRQSVVTFNPLVEADSYSKQLQYAAWFRKNQFDFLGHIEDKSLNAIVNQARLIKGRVPLSRHDEDAIAFDESLFPDLYNYGFGDSNHPAVALRDQLILLLMHGGGLRISEALGLWVTDVYESPDDSNCALVRIYHPEDGKAPNEWKSQSGKTNRSAYLREKYALVPRTQLFNTQRLGWKCRVMDHKDNFIQVHWFPMDFGRLFMLLWKKYLRYLASVERHHPYAFISFEKRSLGNCYTQAAFNDSYKKALNRIKLKPSKSVGLSPHSHRHSYGRRLERAGVSPFLIKKCMHHASIESQSVYTTPSLAEVSKRLSEATNNLNNGAQSPSYDWSELVKYGFDDIDPSGLFSGASPKFRK